MYYIVERSVAVIKPKQPFLDWIQASFTDLPQELMLETIRVDCNSYLIPEVEEIEDGVNFIDDIYAELFALELASWTEDESVWPENLSLKMFWEWFDIEIHPTVVDLTEINEKDRENITIH